MAPTGQDSPRSQIHDEGLALTAEILVLQTPLTSGEAITHICTGSPLYRHSARPHSPEETGTTRRPRTQGLGAQEAVPPYFQTAIGHESGSTRSTQMLSRNQLYICTTKLRERGPRLSSAMRYKRNDIPRFVGADRIVGAVASARLFVLELWSSLFRPSR